MEEYRTMKKRYLIVHDYGAGGVWGVMSARNEQEIRQKYPKLAIVESRPQWMTDALYRDIVIHNSFDIDSEPYGWLAKLNE
jgi:hypothetical protein